MSNKPVIFLAFANDKVDNARYLRNLPNELEGLRKALQKVVQAGLCEVVERANVSIDNLLDVFQEYKDRVCIFHYGGHADGYQLLLESYGATNQTAHGEGLVSFLAKQPGLKLVFFNGCSTQQQTLELVQAGVPAVVGTSSAINDDIATDLSIRFYNGIANGLGLDRAWAEAVDNIVIREGSANKRGLYRKKEKEEAPEDRFPWNLYYREGAEVVKEWNLPAAANDPLFGLPPIPASYQLPPRPFIYLKRFEREHAKVFFGRAKSISNLYKIITDRKAPAVTLMYGSSGVGKSSLLDAGLLPRLEGAYEVVYMRRIQEKGLLGSLEEALGLSQEKLNLRQLQLIAEDYGGDMQREFSVIIDKLKQRQTAAQRGMLAEEDLEDYLLRGDLQKFWKQIERELGKPLVIILDQVEEMYTRPMPDERLQLLKQANVAAKGTRHPHAEFDALLRIVTQIFGNMAQAPQGKLILSYRKEFHPEIEDGLKLFGLPRANVFLEPLKHENIIEIVSAYTLQPELRQQYRLQVAQGLAETIATDLTINPDTPIAPLLQITLSRLWDETANENPRQFDLDDYETLRKWGLTMPDFFAQQLEYLDEWQPEVVHSGFALDLLRFHVTLAGTAAARKVSLLEEEYAHRRAELLPLLQKCSELSLLAEIKAASDTATGTYMLAHDTLAPIVIKEFSESLRPAQRAHRLLSGKVADAESVLNDEELDAAQKLQRIAAIIVAERDLEIIENGLPHMRAIGDEEQALIARSRVSREVARRKRYLTRVFFGVAGVLMVLAAITGFALWRFSQTALAKAQANQVMSLVLEQKLKNPTLALRMLEQAYQIYPSNASQQKLTQMLGEFSFYRSRAELPADYVRIAPDGQRFYLFYYTDSLPRCTDLQGKPLVQFKGMAHRGGITRLEVSPNGKRIVSADAENNLLLWNENGQWLRTLQKGNNYIELIAFSPAGRYILAGNSNRLAVWNEDGLQLAQWDLGGSDLPLDIAFSPDDKYIAQASSEGHIKMWNLQGQQVGIIGSHDGLINSVEYSPNGQWLITASDDGTARIWDAASGQLVVNISSGSSVKTASFAGPDRVLTAGGRGAAALWHVNTATGQAEPIQFFYHEEDDYIEQALVINNGRQLVTAALNDVRVWDLNVNYHQQFNNFSDNVSFVGFHPNGKNFAALEGPNLLHIYSTTDFSTFAHDTVMLAYEGYVGLHLSPDHQQVVALNTDSVFVFGTTGKLKTRFRHYGGNREAMQYALSTDQQLLAISLGSDQETQLWTLDGKEQARLQGTGRNLVGMAFSPNGKRLLTGGYSPMIWDTQNGQALHALQGHEGMASIVAYSPQGNLMATGGQDRRVLLWNANGQSTATLDHPDAISALAFSPDGSQLLAACANQTIHLWDTNNGRLLATFVDRQEPTQLAFAPNGQYFLSFGMADRALSLFNIKENELQNLLASQKIARFSIIDFAEAKVPIDNDDLDTLNNPQDLNRAAKFYMNKEVDIEELDREKRLDYAKELLKKSRSIRNTSEAVQSLIAIAEEEGDRIELDKYFEGNMPYADLQSHIAFLQSRLTGQEVQIRRLDTAAYAQQLLALSRRAVGIKRNSRGVIGLATATKLLGKRLTPAETDSLFASNNEQEVEEYARYLRRDSLDRLTRKPNLYRATKLYDKLLGIRKGRASVMDSVEAASAYSRLGWYQLSDNDLELADASLQRTAKLFENEYFLRSNQALADVLSRRPDRLANARKTYLAYYDKPFWNRDQRTFNEEFKAAIESLRRKGVFNSFHDKQVQPWIK